MFGYNTHRHTGFHAPGEIRTHNPSRRAAADQRLRPRGRWDRPVVVLLTNFQERWIEVVVSSEMKVRNK